jgi:hypothetical protein
VLHALSSFQRTKDISFFKLFSPVQPQSILLDTIVALFGGTLQTYDDYAFPVNPFSRFGENCSDDFPGSAMLLTENIA